MDNLNKQIATEFILDRRIESSTFHLIDWPLSRVFLKNNSLFPWLILVPVCFNVIEISSLSKEDRIQLMDEIYSASLVMQDLYKPDKINTGSLGNIVSQLHIHVVARYQHDLLWPHGVWQGNLEEQPYLDVSEVRGQLVERLSAYFTNFSIF